jgi:hypothetical protein
MRANPPRRLFVKVKELSVRDFLVGVLTAAVLLMLMGAGPARNPDVGRFVPSAGGGEGGYSVCITDTTTGDTRCRGGAAISGGGFWAFSPDFSK